MRSLPDNASNLEASIRGRVRIGGYGQNKVNACKHRYAPTSQMRAERLEPKGKQLSPECLTSRRRELTGLPVYRADLNPPVMNAEHGKAASLDYVSGQSDRKAGPAGAALGWPKKLSRFVMNRICPRRSGLERRGRYVEPLQLGNCNRRATPVAWCTQSRCPQEHGAEGRDPVLPNGQRGLRCAR